MLLLNKREERMAVRDGGRILEKKKQMCYLCSAKHREIGHEHRENIGNLILAQTWPP